ncbi:hypothetical protein PR048_026862 [Dryococelus australis]|uniref:Uncharacterized protein n=1 Tax=Dryococelus australis TaxID=614101 RepID=A0ABQ9GMH3_9NEOP|nr:hypothetical protein PR048_026862 [Dryococelus australis]
MDSVYVSLDCTVTAGMDHSFATSHTGYLAKQSLSSCASLLECTYTHVSAVELQLMMKIRALTLKMMKKVRISCMYLTGGGDDSEDEDAACSDNSDEDADENDGLVATRRLDVEESYSDVFDVELGSSKFNKTHQIRGERGTSPAGSVQSSLVRGVSGSWRLSDLVHKDMFWGGVSGGWLAEAFLVSEYTCSGLMVGGARCWIDSGPKEPVDSDKDMFWAGRGYVVVKGVQTVFEQTELAVRCMGEWWGKGGLSRQERSVRLSLTSTIGESNPVRLGVRRAVYPLSHRGPFVVWKAAWRLCVAHGNTSEPGSIPGGVTPDFRMRESCRAMPLGWSAGFLGALPVLPPFHSCVALYSLQSPSSSLKTSLLRAG